MDYRKIYNALIERARTRAMECYTERHHVLPKCLGGTNANGNIVRLTAEEHYLAHQLLVKIYPNHMGLLGAAMMMASGSEFLHRNNKVYGWLRRRFATYMTGRVLPRESIEKIAAKNRLKVRTDGFKAGVAAFHTGRVRSEETRARMRVSQVKSPETRAKLSAAHTGKVFSAEARSNMAKAKQGTKHSAETRQKMSEIATGRPKSEETRRRMGEVKRRMAAEKRLSVQPTLSVEMAP